MFLIMGNKKTRENLQNQIELNPLTLCGKKMKEVTVVKYLGGTLID